MADDNTRGVQLNEKQLVFVLMAAGVICGVVFLFGVMVGRNVQVSRGGSTDGTMISPPQVVSDPQPGADAPAAVPAGAAGDEYSYPKRLSQAEPPVEQLKPAGSAGAGGASPPVAAQSGPPAASQPSSPTTAVSAPPEVPDEAATVKPQPEAEAAPAANRGAPPAAAKPVEDPTASPYTVQMLATKKRSEADTLARKLKTKGFDARVVVPEPGDKSGAFRVRVGAYKTRAEAEAAATRLTGEGPNKPWVTR